MQGEYAYGLVDQSLGITTADASFIEYISPNTKAGDTVSFFNIERESAGLDT